MLGHQKKRSSTDLPLFTPHTGGRGGHITSFSTASSLSRQPLSGRNAGTASASVSAAGATGSGVLGVLARDRERDRESPPASAYFSNLLDSEEPTAREGASQHFAYSTTLRRHHASGDSDSHGYGHGYEPSEGYGHGGGGGSGFAAKGSKFHSIGRIVSAEGVELIDRVISTVSGSGPGPGRRSAEGRGLMDDERLNVVGNGFGDGSGFREKGTQETPSSIYAHLSIEDTVTQLNTSLTAGILSTSIPALRQMYGYNEFSVETPEPVWIKFLKNIYEQPLILLLLGSAVVSAFMRNYDDAISISLAILIVLTVGFVQERRSEKSLEALNKLVPHYTHLIRDGAPPTKILANELVPGDLVSFSVGDRIPADIRLVDAVELEVDESSLTGETGEVRKNVERCGDRVGLGVGMGGEVGTMERERVALAERKCIAFMGTLVRSGHGKGIVVATGSQTEFGVIFSMMQDVEEKRTPLQLSMDELAKKLSMFSFGVIGVICFIGILQHRHWLDMFTIGVSLAVAAIPEGLPIVTTVTLALGVLRMSKRNAIVKRLPSVESLGSVSVICSDKTGTLTKNEQTIVEAYVVDELIPVPHDGHIPSSYPPSYSSTSSFVSSATSTSASPALKKLLEVGALCNNAVVKSEGHGIGLLGGAEGVVMGQSTDVALLKVLSVYGIGDPRKSFKRIGERPFNSEQKYMAISGTYNSSTSTVNNTTSETDTRERCYIKGALEVVLDKCKYYYVSEDVRPVVLDEGVRRRIIEKAGEAADTALRVIGLAYGFGRVDSDREDDQVLTNLIFVGFQCMRDPLRPGVADAVAALQTGGVHVVMITGDAEHTALAIAKQLGLCLPVSGGGIGRVGRGHGGGGAKASFNTGCLTGADIDRMSPNELRERVGSVSVFARTTPRHKMSIIQAFRSRGEVVAMTGDGVNDAPALKMADIGISMGKVGTDVAKEAGDVILVDDNFGTIWGAVEEGKMIYWNVQSFLGFQLSTAVAAIGIITISTVWGVGAGGEGGSLLNAMQILFVNILMDGPPSQSLGVDPADPAVMKRPPRRRDEGIITRRVVGRVIFSALVIIIGTMIVYGSAVMSAIGEEMSRREQTMTFTSFVTLDLVSAIQNRGLGCKLTQNKMLIMTVGISFLVQMGIVYVPFMQGVFQTVGLAGNDLGFVMVIAGIGFVLHEGRRRYERYLNFLEWEVGRVGGAV